MKSVTQLLAYRYVYNRFTEHTISFMVVITFMSIFIGAFSLALITAIMNGFEKTIHAKIQHIHPTATIYAHHPLQVDAIKQVIATEFPDITAISPQAIGHVLVNPSMEDDIEPIVAMLKGINPYQEAHVSAIHKQLITPITLADAIRDNNIMLGKELARLLGVSVGSTISLFYIEQPQAKQRKVSIEQKDAIVGAIFDTGIDEYDTSMIYCSLSFFETLFPDRGITQIGLAIHQNSNMPALTHALSQRLSLPVHRWQELYPALMSALALEKYAMFFILLLITIVASMNIIALICMFITYKKSDIAILRALGMSTQNVRRLYILIGMGIAGIATIGGIISAWLASVMLEKYPIIQLPDAYYVSHLTAHMNITIAAIVFFVVLFVTFCASWFATRQIQSINVSHVLRFEG